MKALQLSKKKRSQRASQRTSVIEKASPAGQVGQLGELVRTVGLVGIVFGVNPLAAHLVVYAGGPALLAYGFAAFCMLLFCGWWILKALPPFKNTVF
jgi:hypothetical protein